MVGINARLAGIMGDAGRERVEVCWGDSVERLGVRMPSDYREFVERYGHVQFGDDLVVAAPVLVPVVPGGNCFDGIYYFNKDLGEMLEGWYEWSPEIGRPYETFPARGCLLGWGNNTISDYFCWDTSAGDPDLWTVVVWRFDISEMIRFDGGMTEFLAAVLTGEFPDADEFFDRSTGSPTWRSL
ncbi:SMI1/KNR4 family protein [Kitasatospora sp. NPDC051170]|uniref:SMI1/KNR4 family protein n=1 Tax=Kitasatospora sp. NPDC051170 TaxID=3364056 RepID=UPI00378D3AAB